MKHARRIWSASPQTEPEQIEEEIIKEETKTDKKKKK